MECASAFQDRIPRRKSQGNFVNVIILAVTDTKTKFVEARIEECVIADNANVKLDFLEVIVEKWTA